MGVRKLGMAVALAAMVAVPLEAQQVRSGPPDQGDPLELLLGIGRELHLTPEQVATMRAIQTRLEAANRPHVERLVQIQREIRSEYVPVSSSRPGSRTSMPSEAQMELARVPMERIQANNLAAMVEVNELLTDDQKRTAAELLQIRRRGFDRRPTWIRFPTREP
jgi:hypothetical protein